jgi:hypothetical protein
MYKISKLSAVLIAGLLLGGCANSDLKPTDILCPLLGGTLGAGVVAGGLDGDDKGAMMLGAAVGAGLGHFLCTAGDN